MLTTAPRARRGRASLLARPWGAFTRGMSPTAAFDVADTASISATEEPIDERTIVAFDEAALVLVDVVLLGRAVAVADDVALRVTETYVLDKPTLIDNPASDTAALVLGTEAAALEVAIVASDTASLAITDDTPTVDTTAALVLATDTVSVTIAESASVSTQSATAEFATADSGALRLAAETTTLELQSTAARHIERIEWTTTQWHGDKHQST